MAAAEHVKDQRCKYTYVLCIHVCIYVHTVTLKIVLRLVDIKPLTCKTLGMHKLYDSKKKSQICFFHVHIFLSWRLSLPEPFEDRGGCRETVSEKIMSLWNHCQRVKKQEVSQSFSLSVGVENWLQAFLLCHVFPYLQTYRSVKNKHQVWSLNLLLLCGQLTSLVQFPCCTGIL